MQDVATRFENAQECLLRNIYDFELERSIGIMQQMHEAAIYISKQLLDLEPVNATKLKYAHSEYRKWGTLDGPLRLETGARNVELGDKSPTQLAIRLTIPCTTANGPPCEDIMSEQRGMYSIISSSRSDAAAPYCASIAGEFRVLSNKDHRTNTAESIRKYGRGILAIINKI